MLFGKEDRVEVQGSVVSQLTYDALSIRISCDQRRGNLQLTFPTPLMTPPDTSTYFMMLLSVTGILVGKGREERELPRTREL
jgi:hypothetical protein